jgi:hypothetical protein
MADNLDALGHNLKDESVDLVYLASISRRRVRS